MPLGTLQSFAQNLQPGLASLGEMIAQLQAKKAAGANVNAAMAGQDSGQPAPDANSPPLAALAALAGSPPAGQPQQSPGQPHAIPTGPVPAGASFAQAFGQQAQGAPAQGGPTPQQTPQQQPPVPGLSSTAQPDAAGMDDPVKAGQQSLYAMIRSIKAANPGISNTTLMAAARQQIDDIKGVAPLTKAAMSAQVAMLNVQVKQQALQQRIASEDQRWQVARQTANSRDERNRIDEEHFKAMEALGQGRIDEGYAGIEERARAAAGRDATTIAATGMRDDTSRANNAGTNARQDRGTAQRQDAQRQQNYRSVYAAYLRAHPKDQAGAVRAAREASGGGAQPSGGGAPVKVSTPEQARKLPKGTRFVTPDGRQFVA